MCSVTAKNTFKITSVVEDMLKRFKKKCLPQKDKMLSATQTSRCGFATIVKKLRKK